jgi:hypothetical protein
MGGSHKGSSFEREICKLLSCWWSKGIEGVARDDIFWRSSQSGGRATQRAKFGKKTFGSYGDIAAVDPIGIPLLKVFTIELKRGRSHGCPNDLLDCKPSTKPKPFEQCLMQAIDAHKRAGSLFWMLLCRRDGRVSMVYVDLGIVRGVRGLPTLAVGPRVYYDIKLCSGRQLRFLGVKLDDFLSRVKPQDIANPLE